MRSVVLNNDAVFDEPKCAWSVWHVLNVKAGLQKYDQIIVCFWYHQKQFVIKGKKTRDFAGIMGFARGSLFSGKDTCCSEEFRLRRMCGDGGVVDVVDSINTITRRYRLG